MEENKPLQDKPKAKRKKPTPKVSPPSITNVCMEMSEVTTQFKVKKSSEKNSPIPVKPLAISFLYYLITIKQQINLLKIKFKNLHQHFKRCDMFNKESLIDSIRTINNKPL